MDKLSELIKKDLDICVAVEENEDRATLYTLKESVDVIRNLIRDGVSVKLYHVTQYNMSVNAEEELERISEDLSCNQNLEDWELEYDKDDIQALQYVLDSIMRKNEGNNYYFEFGEEIEIDLKYITNIRNMVSNIIGKKYRVKGEYVEKCPEQHLVKIYRDSEKKLYRLDIKDGLENIENKKIENLENKIKELNDVNNSLNVLINAPLCDNPITTNYNVEKILRENKFVDIRFKFDWNKYSSTIVIIGRDTNEEYEQRTPQIPLIGGAWSNFVATRCLTGQVFISSLLECVRLQLEFMAKEYDLNTTIIKHDNCFYAPYMTYMIDDNGNEYHELLKNNYTEAYKQVINLKNGENYWEKYHDIY